MGLLDKKDYAKSYVPFTCDWYSEEELAQNSELRAHIERNPELYGLRWKNESVSTVEHRE